MPNRTLTFQSKDMQFGLQIPKSELQSIYTICSHSQNETGGIMIGYYSDDLSFAKVTKLTSPPAGSICRAFSFIREGKSLARILDKYWEKKQYYLGEWHFHPNASARPSRTDLNTMQKLAGTESIHCPEPILFIIGGNNTSWAFSCYVFANGSEIQLFQLD